MPEPKPVKTCQQVLTNGHLCKCPALRTAALCYYHHRDLQRRRILEKAREVQRSYDKHRESRTEEEFNAEVVESLDLPALDDRASIQVACTNVMRAVYCNHITAAKARIMMRAITEANLCLRRGNVPDEYKQPVLECDPEPIAALGDSDGCVLPEQRGLKQAIVDNRREAAAHADADIAAARARGEDPPPRALTPEEEHQRAIDATRESSFLEMDALFAEVMANSPPDSEYYLRAQRERAHLAAHRAKQSETRGPSRQNESARDDKVGSVGGEDLQVCGPLLSKGQDFSPAIPSPSGTARLHPCDPPHLIHGASAPGGRAGLQASEPLPSKGQDFSPAIPASSEGHGFSRADSRRRNARSLAPE